VLKKRTRKNKEAPPDVHADDPVGTMDRFTAGLQRVLSAKRQPRPIGAIKKPRR
jgi:hypothetical protein